MLAITFWIGVSLLRWALVAACVTAYVEVGPGGEALGNVVDAIKGVLLSIDWATLWGSVSVELEKAARAIFDSVVVQSEGVK